MQKAIIGKKIGMTQIFDETGKVVPVTVVEAVRALSHRRRQLKTTAMMQFSLALAIRSRSA